MMMEEKYQVFLERLENRSYAEAIELTFTKAIPNFISCCENEIESINLLISLLDLVRSKKNGNFQDVVKENGFYHYYDEFCNHFFAMIDSCSSEVKGETYEILEMFLNDIITDLFIEGLNNGTIAPEDLEGNSDFVIEDGELFDYIGYDENVTIPTGVIWIGEQVFEGSNVRSVIIPEGVRGIDFHSFSECENLKNIVLPESLVYIGNAAFKGCRKLENIKISECIEVGNGAFAKCNALSDNEGWIIFQDICYDNVSSSSKLKIPNNVKKISGGAFFDLKTLKTMIIPENIKEICCWSFQHCKNLEAVFFLNDSVEIENYVFEECDYDKLVIYGKPGSTAEQYALERRIKFMQFYAID